uniref:Uncharacterized protein n=1 Tax=Seriola dumerili TaxID=41447 RepID=A0A3B4TCC2_SERDU
MDRVPVVNYCLGLLGLLLLQGALNVEGRSIFNPGNHVFNPKEDTVAQSKVLALLLHKSLIPIEKDDPLANLAESKSIAQKRGEREFNSVLLDLHHIITIAVYIHCMSDVMLQVFTSFRLQLASGNTVSETDARGGGPL